jgi:integrase
MKQLPGFSYDARKKRAVFDGYVPGTHGRVRRQRTVENVTRDKALTEWRTFRADLQSGRAVEGPLTLRDFVARYYDVIAARHEESTRVTQRSIIKNHLLRYFGDTYLDAITTIRVTDLMADMRNRNCSAAYVNDTVRLLKMLLRQAVERDVIADYPIRKRVPKEKEAPLRLELRADERARFFATFDDEAAFRRHVDSRRQLGPTKESSHFGTARRFGGGLRGESKATGRYFERFRELREFFVIAVETGLRNQSDLRNLRWEQVDLEAGFIRVLMQKTQLEAEIPISSACRQALLACRARRRDETAYVFVDASGKRYSTTRIRRTFRLAKALASITRRLRPHDLRHTFGCRLASKSVSLQIIAKALGHTTTRMAERYARPSQAAMRAVINALDGDPLLPGG